jgi:hypothetical protein
MQYIYKHFFDGGSKLLALSKWMTHSQLMCKVDQFKTLYTGMIGMKVAEVLFKTACKCLRTEMNWTIRNL